MTNQIVKQYKLNYFDPAENSNKVWIGAAHADGTFEAKYGRVRDGTQLAVARKSLGSASSAAAELERKRGEKLRKGYRDSATLSDGDTVTTAAVKTDLKAVAAAEISGGDDPTTAALIKYLAEVNIHNITSATNIRYNETTGAFRTPLGVLTPEAVGNARGLLQRIEMLNVGASVTMSRRAAVVRDYFQLVPRDFGARIPDAANLLATAADVQKESAILDSLEAAFVGGTESPAAKLFECKLVKVPGSTDDGRTTFRRLNKLFLSTRNAGHAATAQKKLVRVYAVEIPTVKTAFTATAAKLGNTRADLWHGTRASNLLSILKSGLMIPSASAAQCTGRMFGNGIYSSLQSTKALNYATGMWNASGAANQRTFMFLCEAALGREYKPARSFSDRPPRGFDSAWVEAGSAGVMNHECVVYDTAQFDLKYLCEFE